MTDKSTLDFTQQYEFFAQELLCFLGNQQWQQAYIKYEVFNQMISIERWFVVENQEFWLGNEIPDEIWDNSSKSVYYIRDKMLENMGHRIWGLLFTLYPDGKFEIEYDYDKPDDYEESDDIILGDEINQSLDKLGIR
ncbi:hypothetical protein LU290_02150 [Moraxella nasibovis]|uniref:hypothetical protein n=1 Tax=Moraxella nasibovis TaxID=2904120 RepID=UPI00240FB252|nr:hypothetical protein [Moraxella nasibovis]WFF39055.1 hypothetical protein LU290_02150 [Moraxella nasibovis]